MVAGGVGGGRPDPVGGDRGCPPSRRLNFESSGRALGSPAARPAGAVRARVVIARVVQK
jgi:hypothetical protein